MSFYLSGRGLISSVLLPGLIDRAGCRSNAFILIVLSAFDGTLY